MAAMPAARRQAIQRGARKLIQEELTLRELRKARQLTQVEIARELHTSQDAISRIESRADLMLSTLRKYVEAAGGELQLTAHFPGRAPVAIAGLGELSDGNDGRPSP